MLLKILAPLLVLLAIGGALRLQHQWVVDQVTGGDRQQYQVMPEVTPVTGPLCGRGGESCTAPAFQPLFDGRPPSRGIIVR